MLFELFSDLNLDLLADEPLPSSSTMRFFEIGAATVDYVYILQHHCILFS